MSFHPVLNNCRNKVQCHSASRLCFPGITDEVIKKYLMRKPTTAKELLQRVKSKYPNVEKDKLVTAIAAILKKVNPSKKKDSQGNNLYFIEK